MSAQGAPGAATGSREQRAASSRRNSSNSASAAAPGGGSGGGSSDPARAREDERQQPREDAEAEAEALAHESDHYIVLGVTADATEKQIQQAYRMRSLKFHPDRKGGSTATFQRIAQAFQTLSDTHKRAAYDQGSDIKCKRGGGDGSSDDEDEERQQSLREEIERKYYPERYEYWPFGDPFINKRKRQELKRRQQGRPPTNCLLKSECPICPYIGTDMRRRCRSSAMV
jgi:hypothetical protein